MVEGVKIASLRRKPHAPWIPLVRVVHRAVDCVTVHRPVLLGQHRLARLVAVSCAEASLVVVRPSASDLPSGNLALVRLVSRVGDAVVAADRATLRPPQAGLAAAPFFAHAHIAFFCVCAGAGCGWRFAPLEFLEHPVHRVAGGRDDHGHMCGCQGWHRQKYEAFHVVWRQSVRKEARLGWRFC